jgi:hypothetical protein
VMLALDVLCLWSNRYGLSPRLSSRAVCSDLHSHENEQVVMFAPFVPPSHLPISTKQSAAFVDKRLLLSHRELIPGKGKGGLFR